MAINGQWLDAASAARALGIKKKSLSKRVERGMLEDNGKKGKARLFYVPLSPQLTLPTPAPAPRVEPTPTADGRYYSEIDSDRQIVIAYIPFLKAPLRVSFDDDAAIHRAYSSDGENMTVKQMARKFAFNEKILRGYLRARGLQHASLVWPEHEMATMTDTELLESAEAIRAAKVQAQLDKKDVHDLKRKAALADNLEGWFEKVGKAFESELKVQIYAQVPADTVTGDPLAWIVPETDTHIDAMGVSGASYEDQRELVRQHRRRLIQRCQDIGPVSAWHKWVGSDLADGDNKQGTTTKGTPQVQTLPKPQIVPGIVTAELEACETYLSTGAPLHLYKVNGNHDWYTTDWLWALLQQRYANHPRVWFCKHHAGGRSYARVGGSLCIFAHGHVSRLKESVLREMALTEAADLLAAVQKIHVLRGDKHTRRQIDSAGGSGQDVGVAAMSPQTPWSEEQGYIYSPRLHAFGITASGGMAFDITSEE